MIFKEQSSIDLPRAYFPVPVWLQAVMASLAGHASPREAGIVQVALFQSCHPRHGFSLKRT
jgi:hypothetical protein